MWAVKYILLYIPIVLLSAIGVTYYGLEWAGIEPTQDLAVIEAYNFALYLSFLCWAVLIWHLLKHGISSMSFRVQLEHMIILFVAPKAIDHFSKFKATLLDVEPLLDPYAYSVLPYVFLGIFILITPIRIFYLNRKKRYNGT